jgi:hypothetical protein
MAKKTDKNEQLQGGEEQPVVEEVESTESEALSDSVENTEEKVESENEDSTMEPQETSDPSEEECTAIKNVILVHTAALGNGTRQRGTIIGCIGENGDLVPADGITEIEVKTLSLNPHLYEIKEAKQ